ncbi:MAG: ribonuclease H-like domain-containing protein [Anaerolineae bacterium]
MSGEPMSMRDRLERLRGLGVRRGSEVFSGTPAAPPAPPRSIRHRQDISDVVVGSDLETPHGACFVAETHYAEHGGLPVGAPLPLAGLLPRLLRDDALGRVDLRRAVFLDVETTGLSGGTGTFAFLVGIGTFEGDTFRVRQFFMRDPGAEPSLLHALSEAVAGYDAVVTFNGRSFDMPLLTTRFRLQRRRAPLADAPHLDLLLPARRLWRARLGSCSLGSLERGILGVERVDDVPGMIIPYLYFDYVRTGRVERLERVFYHNALDIVTMAALLARMSAILDDPEGSGICHGADWLSLGVVYDAVGDEALAGQAYQRAMGTALPPELHEQAKERYGALCKRQGAWDEAVAGWAAAVEAGTTRRLYPYLELAKYYEHRRRDYPAAVDVVRRAIALVETATLRDGSLSQAATLAELRHRLARLERKSGVSGD